MDLIEVVLVHSVCAEQHVDGGRTFDLGRDLLHAGKTIRSPVLWSRRPAVTLGDLALPLVACGGSRCPLIS